LLEKIISLSEVSLIDFLGVANVNINLLTHACPQSKIIARGEQLTVRGSNDQIALVEAIVNSCIAHLDKHHTLSEKHMQAYIDSVLNPTGEETSQPWVEDKDVLLFGNKGIVIKAKTPNQRKLVDAAIENDIVFAIGPAGTGKTLFACNYAISRLHNNSVKKIIITRPMITIEENMGYLPGDINDKMQPFMNPIYDIFLENYTQKEIESLRNNNVIKLPKS
jgi:phosphate starvation-inducible PhoH-like protein